MKIEEANKIIAEYMGTDCKDSECDWNTKGDTCKICTDRVFDSKLKYDQSLDALVHVWEKLESFQPEFTIEGISSTYKGKVIYWSCTDTYAPYDLRQKLQGSGKTPQEAAAISTAKTIKEIK